MKGRDSEYICVSPQARYSGTLVASPSGLAGYVYRWRGTALERRYTPRALHRSADHGPAALAPSARVSCEQTAAAELSGAGIVSASDSTNAPGSIRPGKSCGGPYRWATPPDSSVHGISRNSIRAQCGGESRLALLQRFEPIMRRTVARRGSAQRLNWTCEIVVGA